MAGFAFVLEKKALWFFEPVDRSVIPNYPSLGAASQYMLPLKLIFVLYGHLLGVCELERLQSSRISRRLSVGKNISSFVLGPLLWP